MKTVEIRVDSVRGRLKAKGALYAGSKVRVSFSPEAGDTAQLGLFVFDRRQYEEPRIEPRISVFPPPGLKCIAVTERREDGTFVLDLNVQELLDLFADGKRMPGSRISAHLYLWDRGTPEVVAAGLTAVEWSPVYFTPTRTPVMMKGERGAKGDKGDPGEDGAPGERGERGYTGLQGPQGERGPRGLKGDRGERGPRGVRGPAVAESKYVRCAATGRFHLVTVRHNDFGEPVLDVDAEERETLPEGVSCGIEGLFGLDVGEDGHLYVTVADGREDFHFSIEDGHLKLQIGE